MNEELIEKYCQKCPHCYDAGKYARSCSLYIGIYDCENWMLDAYEFVVPKKCPYLMEFTLEGMIKFGDGKGRGNGRKDLEDFKASGEEPSKMGRG